MQIMRDSIHANGDINCDTEITGLLQEQLIGADNNRSYIQ